MHATSHPEVASCMPGGGGGGLKLLTAAWREGSILSTTARSPQGDRRDRRVQAGGPAHEDDGVDPVLRGKAEEEGPQRHQSGVL